MASSNCSLKIVEVCRVAPPPFATKTSLPLTFFDLFWLRFHPVERLFFYSLPHSLSNPSFFFDSVLPKFKRSLSLTLQHFLPLAGTIIWPPNSYKPIVQFTPGDAVSLVIAQSDSGSDSDFDFDRRLDNCPREAIQSRPFVPHLDSSDSFASVFSLQITLFPNRGFCVGISTHHAVFDGKSSTMLLKAWACLCRTEGERLESSSLPRGLDPLLEREVIIDPSGLEISFINVWAKFDPINKNEKSLKILSNTFPPILDHRARATFELKLGDLEKMKKRILDKWDDNESTALPKPQSLSTFVLTTAYVSVCIARATEKTEKRGKKFVFVFTMDCRRRLDAPVPENYFGNCVMSRMTETEPEEFTDEDGIFIVAKKIHNEIRTILEEKGALDGADTLFSRYSSLISEGVLVIGVAGSTRFGVYETDFGWGRPEKVEITSVDRGVTIGMAESRDGNGGVEVGLVLNEHVMNCFTTIFHAEIESL